MGRLDEWNAVNSFVAEAGLLGRTYFPFFYLARIVRDLEQTDRPTTAFDCQAFFTACDMLQNFGSVIYKLSTTACDEQPPLAKEHKYCQIGPAMPPSLLSSGQQGYFRERWNAWKDQLKEMSAREPHPIAQMTYVSMERVMREAGHGA